MASDYPGLTPARVPANFRSPVGTAFDNYIVPNVQTAFTQLPEYPDYLAARIPRGLFPNRRYTSHAFATNNKLKNHFQGIQRLRDSNYLLVSAGDSTEGFAQFFLCEIQAQSDRLSPLGSNILDRGVPDRKDKLIEVFHLNSGQKKFWHAGGMAILGDILAVPLENTSDKSSDVVFYNLKDPLKPIKYPFSILRRRLKAGCTSLCKLPNGFFLCAVWVDSEVDDAFFSFYISKSRNFDDGFHQQEICRVLYKDITNRQRDKVKYQAIQALVDRKGDIYLIGSENEAIMAPTFDKKNMVELLGLRFTTDITNQTSPSPDLIHITRNAERLFPVCDPYGNFDAGVGAYVDADGRLALYSAYHWRNKRELKFCEFYQTLRNRRVITDPEESWIELYEEPNFKGRRFKLYGTKAASYTNYKDIKVQDKSFDDKVSSVVFQIPVGHQYRLYKNKHFDEHGQTLDLKGEGKIVSIENLDAFGNFRRETSSSAYT